MLTLLLTSVFSLLVNNVDAAEVINDTEVFLFADKTYEENLYVGAGKTVVESNVSEDLVVLGGEAVVSGKVVGDVFVLGGAVNFKGETVGDLRIIGGEVIIDGVVGGDVFIVGGDITISEEAAFGGDIFAVGGNINVLNDSSTELKVIAGKVYLNGKIAGQTEVTTQSLVIGNEAEVVGDLAYYAPQEFFLENGGSLVGNISFNEINSIRDTGVVKKAILSFMSFWFFLRFITTLIIAFILVYVFKVFTQGVSDLSIKSFWKSLLAGILVILFSPLVVAILIMSLFALPIGLLLMMSLVFIAIISTAASAIFLGVWAGQYLNRGADNVDTVSLKSATIGVILLTLLQFIPIVGDLAKLILFIVAFGAIVRYIRVAIIK